MKKIESLENSRIKHARRIADRKIPELWMLEGRKLIEEAVQASVEVLDVFATKETSKKEHHLLDELEKRKISVSLVSGAAMQKISRVETPPGIIATARRLKDSQWKRPARFAALLVSVRDPGNFGSILRAAEGSGCEYIAYTQDCVDPYSPKVVRASTGSILRIPIGEVSSAGEFLLQAETEGITSYALDAHSGENVFQLQPQSPSLLVIGSESHGLPSELSRVRRIRIPMAGKVESLNAALAAGICFYRFADTGSEHE